MKDPIVEEVRKYRQEHAAKFNYDIDAIARDIRRLEKADKRQFVDLSQQPVKAAGKRPRRRRASSSAAKAKAKRT